MQGWLAGHDLKDLFEVDITEVEGLPVLQLPLPRGGVAAVAGDAVGQDDPVHRSRRIGRTPRWCAAIGANTTWKSAFRDLKHVKHLSLRPQRHWTDQKIRVHVFYCVLALMLCGLLRRELDRRGIKRSLPALLEELGQIREVCVVYPAAEPGAEPTIQLTLTELTEEQRALYEALDLGRYRRV